jgi:hypothetical protein
VQHGSGLQAEVVRAVKHTGQPGRSPSPAEPRVLPSTCRRGSGSGRERSVVSEESGRA